MTQLRLFGLVGMILMLASTDVMAQRPGGVVRGGIRGAMVGGLLGGSSGAEVGRAVGAVSGGDKIWRADMNSAYYLAVKGDRVQYQSTTVYKSRTHSNFHRAAPRVIVSSRRINKR